MYNRTTSLKEVSKNDWNDFFINKNISFCGTVTSCNLRIADCSAPYVGAMTVSNSGKVKVP